MTPSEGRFRFCRASRKLHPRAAVAQSGQYLPHPCIQRSLSLPAVSPCWILVQSASRLPARCPTDLEQRASWCELAVGLVTSNLLLHAHPRPQACNSHSLPPCRPPTSARPFPPFPPFLSQFWTDLQPSLWDPRESIICCIARIQATLFSIGEPTPSPAPAIIRPGHTPSSRNDLHPLLHRFPHSSR